jgi:hypothetical protein
MGLADWFGKFCSNIQIQDEKTISQRYKAITQHLNRAFWDTTAETTHSFYVGSYGRNTAIQGFSDLDMVFELPSAVYYQYDGYATNGQAALLQAMRSSMRSTFPSSDIGPNGQAVFVTFQDGAGFKVVPVFHNNSGGYTFPDSNDRGIWRTMNPRREIEAMRTQNNICMGNLVRLCRMMRCWKATWQVPMSGLLIDTLAYQFIENHKYQNKSYFYYDFLCCDFF